jgi:hypothetical protein
MVSLKNFFFSFELRALHSVLYHLIHTSSLFLLWLFWRQGLTICSGQPGSQTFTLPAVAGMTAHATTPSFFSH